MGVRGRAEGWESPPPYFSSHSYHLGERGAQHLSGAFQDSVRTLGPSGLGQINALLALAFPSQTLRGVFFFKEETCFTIPEAFSIVHQTPGHVSLTTEISQDKDAVVSTFLSGGYACQLSFTTILLPPSLSFMVFLPPGHLFSPPITTVSFLLFWSGSWMRWMYLALTSSCQGVHTYFDKISFDDLLNSFYIITATS